MNEEANTWDQEDVDLPEEVLAGMPKPLYWRALVMPIRPKRVSKGGIHLPQEALEAQTYLNYVGKVVALGALAYKHARFEGAGELPKVGDYVIYGRYAGQPLTYKGYKFLFINEDEMLGTCPDPEGLQIQV